MKINIDQVMLDISQIENPAAPSDTTQGAKRARSTLN